MDGAFDERSSAGASPRVAWLLASLHASVAMVYWLTAGLDIAADPLRGDWDWYWQSVPTDDLRHRMLESVWHLHAQPPGHNLLVGVLAKLAWPHHLQALQALHVVLGAAITAMTFAICCRICGSRRAGALIALLVGLHPALFVYAAYPMYSMVAAFLVVLALYCVHRFTVQKQHAALVGFIAAIATLTLVRSVYHVALLVPVIALACTLVGERRGRMFAAGLLIAVLPLSWCGKNLLQHGFFGTSSWAGQGLWRAVAAGRPRGELQDLARQGVIEQLPAQLPSFSPPSRAVVFGFDAVSSVPLLSCDDFHNVNVPAISAVYLRSAVRLLLHDSASWLRNVAAAYEIFSSPSTRYKHVQQHAASLGLHERIYSDVFQLAGHVGSRGSILWALLPAGLLVWLSAAVVACRADPRCWANLLRRDAVLAAAWLLIGYTTLVSCVFEYGENDRFKFMVEPALWTALALMVHRTCTRRWPKAAEILQTGRAQGQYVEASLRSPAMGDEPGQGVERDHGAADGIGGLRKHEGVTACRFPDQSQ